MPQEPPTGPENHYDVTETAYHQPQEQDGQSEASPPRLPMPNKSRLVVVEQVYHQEPKSNPTAVETRYGKWLESDEQPFGPRTLKVTEAWAPVDCGWIDSKNCSMLIVQNREETPIQLGLWIPAHDSLRGPSAELIVPLTKPLLKGESARFPPWDVAQLQIRSIGSQGRYTVTLIPS